MNIDTIMHLLDKPLSDDKELAEERILYIRNELVNFDEEYLIVFYNILVTNSIDKYKDFFSEENFNKIKNLFDGKIVKENFNYIYAIIHSMHCL